jgi:hypothetical protein
MTPVTLPTVSPPPESPDGGGSLPRPGRYAVALGPSFVELTAHPLDPLLVLAGLVAGVAVLCLLLVGSRAAASREGSGD